MPDAVPDAVAPPPGSPRFPLVDGARALAALAILLTHTAGYSTFNSASPLGAVTARLDCGVAVFFVLSGFLLYRPWVAARLDGRPAPSAARYARRRLVRILPAYWLALVVLGTVLPHRAPGVFGGDWWVYFGLLQSWHKVWIIGGIGVAWSLSIEATFYVLLPLLATGGGRLLRRWERGTQVRVELWVLALSAAACVAGRVVARSVDPGGVYGNTLPGLWSWFAAGMGLAVVSSAYARTPVAERPALVRSAAERPALWWAGAAATLLLVSTAFGLPRSFVVPYTTFNLQAEHVCYGLVALLLVAPAVLGDGRRSAPAAVLANPLLAWLGLVSYGIFLWHLPLVDELVRVSGWLPAGGFVLYTAAVLAASTTCAALSYYLVERPILRFKDPRPPRAGAPVRSAPAAREPAAAAGPAA